MSAPEPVIEVRGLAARRGAREVLGGVDLRVEEREIMAIMGPSGAGKSTLFRHLLGLARPASGTVRVLGRDLAALDRRGLYALRKRIGVAFQRGALLGNLSVLENVELPLREHTRLDEATIGIMSRMKLEMMGLGGAGHLMPAELSGGMAKRAGLARAVVMDPTLLVFDEPSAGLDPVASAELDQCLLSLRDALAMTIVVVTHELESAFAVADRLAVLIEGRIALVGTVDEVRASRDPRVQALLGRRPREREIDADAYLDRLTDGHPGMRRQ